MSLNYLILICAGLACATTAAPAAVVAISLSVPLEIRTDFFEEYFPRDIDGDGSTDFTLIGGISGAYIRTERSHRIAILRDAPPDLGGYVAAFTTGALIGVEFLAEPLAFFSGDFAGDNYVAPDESLGAMSIVNCFQTCSYNAFAGGRAYAGFEFQRNGLTHYGYFDMSGAPNSKDIILYGWAWETEPGRAIAAGAIPEPSTAAYIGSTAFLLWQRNAHTRKQNKALQRTARGLLVSTLHLIRKWLGFGGAQLHPSPSLSLVVGMAPVLQVEYDGAGRFLDGF